MKLPELPSWLVLIIVGLGGIIVGKEVKWLNRNNFMWYVWLGFCSFEITMGILLLAHRIMMKLGWVR